ncbi:MAG TPA: hypothetical protein PKH07_04210 [bacterium]|nr:hypothetical protein [bacterium]
MNRVLLAVLVALVCIVGLVLILVQSSDRLEMTPITVSPSISLREEQPGDIMALAQEDKKDFLESLRSQPAGTEHSEPSDIYEATDEPDYSALLRAKTAQWIYRTFSQIGDTKIATMENNETGHQWEVHEKEVYDDVIIDDLAYNRCIVRLEDATAEIPFSPKLTINIDDIFSRPPTEEEIAERVAYYDRHVRPTFEAMAKNYTPMPHQTMPVPLSPEQQATNVEHYMQNIAPTFIERAKSYTPKPGEKMPVRPASTQEVEINVKKYLATYHPTQLATMYPEWRKYFEDREVWDRNYGGTPVPSPNQAPPSNE